MTPEQGLIVAADRLRRAQPIAWNEFRAALAEYSGAALMTLAASPEDVLRLNQGKTQILLALNKLFEEAPQKAEGILRMAEQKQ